MLLAMKMKTAERRMGSQSIDKVTIADPLCRDDRSNQPGVLQPAAAGPGARAGSWGGSSDPPGAGPLTRPGGLENPPHVRQRACRTPAAQHAIIVRDAAHRPAGIRTGRRGGARRAARAV